MTGFGRRDKSSNAKSKRSNTSQTLIDELLSQATQAEAQGNQKQAELCYRKAIAKDSRNYRLYLKLASLYLEKPDLHRARNCFEQAARIMPKILAGCQESALNFDRLPGFGNQPWQAARIMPEILAGCQDLTRSLGRLPGICLESWQHARNLP